MICGGEQASGPLPNPWRAAHRLNIFIRKPHELIFLPFINGTLCSGFYSPLGRVRGACLDFKRRELERNRKVSRGRNARSIISKPLVCCKVGYFRATLLRLTERGALIGGAPVLIRSDFAFVRAVLKKTI